jgi:uncharacterized SAM-binding protein YcdF (DUF218 family)
VSWRRLKRASLALALVLLVVLAYGAATFSEIRRSAVSDQARPADVIIVLGAAQYNGRPSPVLKARLDHALDLFERGFANVIITTGGYGPDPNFSEAHVSAAYLNEKGVDLSQIVTQQGSGSTEDTVSDAAKHLDANLWRRAIVVSDGFHLYRVKEIFRDYGIEVLGSPAPASRIEVSTAARIWFSVREVAVLSAYRVTRLFS